MGGQVVVLSQVLACDATLGVEESDDLQLKRFNGVSVRNLRHLATLVQSCQEAYMRFDLDHHVRPLPHLAVTCADE